MATTQAITTRLALVIHQCRPDDDRPIWAPKRPGPRPVLGQAGKDL